MLIAAKLQIYPLLDFAEGAGFGGYMNGLVHLPIQDITNALEMLVFAILMAFQFALLFFFTRAAWRAWALAPTLFISTYLLGLLVFPGTGYNMRYYLPAFLFLAAPMAAGAASLAMGTRRTILGVYAVTAVLLILTFNFGPMQRAVQPAITRMWTHLPPNGWLDNLRLPVQVAIQEEIHQVNEQVPDGRVLYWSSSYYDTATHGLAEYLGVKKGLDIRYVLKDVDVPPSSTPIFLTEFSAMEPTSKLAHPPTWARVTTLAPGVFRLDPVQ
jgi:hypothetical protein